MGVAGGAWPAVEAVMLFDDFVGVTDDGEVDSGLFGIESTGVDNAPLVLAAKQFIASLDESQKDRLLHPVDDKEWRRWANFHVAKRAGIGYLEMSDDQAEAANSLIRASLSAKGYATAIDVMRLNGYLAEVLDGNYVEFGEKRYWLTIMGDPSTSEPWGWQLDGHHLVINFFVLGDQVVMTPTFMGSEPIRAVSGPYAGIEAFSEETNAGLAFVNSLSSEQRAKAISEEKKEGNLNRAELFKDNVVVPIEGLSFASLSPSQDVLARQLVDAYVGRIREGHAAVRMNEVLEHWDQTYFVWVGETGEDSVFYYRVQSPVIMIEFDHQTPFALDRPDVPDREHVHTVVRTPNGNDYGKDLLRQHLEEHPHPHAH